MSPDLERLIGRAVIDPDFRKQLIADPDGTVKSAGFSLSDDELEQVRKAASEAASDSDATNQKLDALRSVW